MIAKIPSPPNLFKGIGRNDPCPCGSGRKFKKCCLGKSGLEPHEVTLLSGSTDPLPAADDWNNWIDTYDPLVEPDAAEWLALGEQERIDLVVAYHEAAGINVPRATPHAVIHVVVENQIAEGDKLPVKRTAQRLMGEGLDRHEAIHAIGFVLAGHLNELVREFRSNTHSGERTPDQDPNARYFAELERLTADEWRQSG